MEHRGFRAGGNRRRLAFRALIVSVLGTAVMVPAVLAALAVSADAGTPRPQLATVQLAAAAPVGADALGAPAASAEQSGYVVLKPRDEQALQHFITAVGTRHSPQYRDFLGAGQFATRFGPTSSTIAAVRSQLSADGLDVTSVSRDGLLIGFSGTTAQVEAAFGTSLERYRSAAGITGEQTTRAITLPTGISSAVSAVIGLNTMVHPEAGLEHPSASSFSGHAAAKTAAITHDSSGAAPCSAATAAATRYGGLTDDQIANAYGATPLYTSGDTGGGVNIGVYELEPYSSSDLQSFDDCYFGTAQGNAMASEVSTTYVDETQSQAPSGPGSGESILDIEDVSAMAPGAHIDVYEAPDTSSGSLDEYEQIVDSDQDQIITSSWGLCEQDLQLADPGAQQAEDYIFEQAAAQGQTVLSASGDTGDDRCNELRTVPVASDQNPLSVGDPGSQPYVLGVGGTTIQDADPAHYDETAWNDGAKWGGSGGGISESWAAPSWQLSLSYFSGSGYSTDLASANDFLNHDAVADGVSEPGNVNLTPGFCTNSDAADLAGGTICRGVPDVSAQADEFTGAVTVYVASQGGWITYGGTSSATPIWAAMLALVDASDTCPAETYNAQLDEDLRPGIGFAAPLLYAIGANSTEYAESFHDITVGNNDIYGFDDGAVFPARTGYDVATGLGSPILAYANGSPGLASNLCALAGTSGLPGSIPPQISGLSPTSGPVSGGTTVTVSGSGFTGATSVTVGAAQATDVTVVDDNTLTFVLPAGTSSLSPRGQQLTDPVTGVGYTTAGSTGFQDGAGPANVEITRGDGVSSIPSLASQYSYVDENGSSPVPSVSSISPSAGPQGGGPITIYGSGFTGATGVSIGGVSLASGAYHVISDWEITATAPAFSSTATNCVTEPELLTETRTFGLNHGNGDTHTNTDDICQTNVVVSNANGSSTATAPLPSYLGSEPQMTQEGLFEVPDQDCQGTTVGCEMTAQPSEYDYVPTPTITGVESLSTVDGDANADPSTYGEPTVLAITGTGLNWQTLDWLSFGDPTVESDQDRGAPLYADGTTVELNAPASPTVAAGGKPGTAPQTAIVVADSMGGQSSSASCATNPACVTYAGIPVVDSVTATASQTNAAPDTAGTPIAIDGVGLADAVPPIDFIDSSTPSAGGSPYSVGTQYDIGTPTDAEIDTETVAQNPALVDTLVCSDSGCSAKNDGDQLWLYPPGAPLISSVQASSGPALGGTLVTIDGQNLGCATSVDFGSAAAFSISNTAAILDCGSTSQLTVVAPAGVAGSSVPITLSTVESDLTGTPPATSPTNFSYDTANPSATGSVSYGSVDLGYSSTQTVTLSNPSSATQPLYPGGTGTQPKAAFLTGADAGDFRISSDGCTGQTLRPGQSCTLQVTFVPGALGARSATLDIPWNNSATIDASSGTADLSSTLTGSGSEPTATNTVTITTPGSATVTTVTKTVTRTVTCTVTVKWRWVTVKVHHRKRREYRKITTRSQGCPATAKKAAKPKHRKATKPKHRRAAGRAGSAARRARRRG